MKLKILKRTQIKIVASLIIALGFIFFIFITVFILDSVYDNKFYPGVKVSNVSLSGLNYHQAEKIFKSKIGSFQREGQKFFYQNKYFVIFPTTFSANDPDLIYEIVSFDLESTLNQAYALGRGKNLLDSFWQKIKMIFMSKNFNLAFNLQVSTIKKQLLDNFSHLEDPGKNPEIIFNPDQSISLTDEKSGFSFDYAEVISRFEKNLLTLEFLPIELKLKIDQPDFTRQQASFFVDDIQQILDLAPLTIKATSTDYYDRPTLRHWQVYENELKNWLQLKKNSSETNIHIDFKKDQIEKFLITLQYVIEKPVLEAKFKIQDGRVTEFQASRKGQEINFEQTLENFSKDILTNLESISSISVKQIEPKNKTENINDLGIKELIAVGSSNFYGSPRNRRHNIKIGAESINGLIIESEQEFSLNQSLGSVTAAKGYLPELVIKGNETVPEYGGGLCQIATTMFRLAINAGLPITARKPHAYRVTYYEPAGTDATIYSPWPDLRFINDTGSSLLLQTKIIDNELIFEFWGTNDGRQVSTTTPEIYNIVAPGPTKYIETTELAPKVTKCIETAHYGANAHFYRTITYFDKEPVEEIWKSYYRPWQAVCLIGLDPTLMATTTPDIIH